MESIHRFGRFEVRPLQRQLIVDGIAASLGARAFDVLLTLIDRQGQLVSKHELLDAVWPGLVVEENNLVVQVGTLRKLLGAEVIATIPGRGYRFTALADAHATASPFIDAAGVAARPSLRSNLPEVLPALIGRDDDLAALGALLNAHRLITIVGAGGMGKTRLAQRLLHERRGAYEQGVAWVELAGLSDHTLLAATIAGALGLQGSPGDPLKGLVAALKPLSMVVALDNAEHLIDEVASVAQALTEGAPQLRLIITSQAPLKLPIERVYRLGPLAVPEADVPFDEALSYGAVALFVDRAQAANRHFELTEQDLAGVVQICAQLDGLALAIELAAARVPMLSVAALAAALDERLHLLTQGRRGAPQRQRTLRAALEWSHALLTPAEATVFRRLGVFAGGFSLEMACSVAADEPAPATDESLDQWAVVDALGALVDRSLAVAETGELPRYRLLESARTFARERLAAEGEDAKVRRRHVQSVVERFCSVDAACLGGQLRVDEALDALEPDLDNAREALQWSLDNDDTLSAATLVPALSFALNIAGYEERRRLWEATAACMSDDLPSHVKAAWAVGYGGFCFRRAPALAASWARVAIEFYRQSGDAARLYRALGILSMSAVRRRDRDECVAAYEEMREIEDPVWPARLKFFRAAAGSGLELMLDNFDAARSAVQCAQTLAAETGDTQNFQNMLVTLADLDLASGRLDDAVRGGLELVDRLRGTRHQNALAYARVNLTGALLATGALAQARAMALAAWPAALQFDLKHLLADNFGFLAIREGRPNSAARLRGYGDAIYAAHSSRREPNEARAVEQAERLMRAQVGDTEFACLRREGSMLSDEEMVTMALSQEDTGAARR